MMKTIVISAVSLRKGGTLTILRNCLSFLSESALSKEYRIIALVHKKELANFPNIQYVEMPDIIKGWGRRLWCEYVTMFQLSKAFDPVYLWLSLHDTTPRVKAERQAVYCQTSFPFYKWHWRDFLFDYKIPLFSIFTRLVYRINVHKNIYLIVQQEYLRQGLSKMLGVEKKHFIVAPPELKRYDLSPSVKHKNIYYTFLFVSTPDCHKNFETVCEAARLLESEMGQNRFRLLLTIDGTENKYSRWLFRKWGKVKSICFEGLMNRNKLFDCYTSVDCLVFPSKVETWGLPISEFMCTGKPMLLADLPYAHGAAAGSKKTAFFTPEDACQLKKMMKRLIEGDESDLQNIKRKKIDAPKAFSWEELFHYLIYEKPSN